MTQSEVERAAEEWYDKHGDDLFCNFPDPEIGVFPLVKKIFMAGVEHAGPKWIKCSEGLPVEGEWVLVSVNKEHGSEVEMDCTHKMEGGEIIWLICQQIDRYPDAEFSDVTHWMPLPQPPEAESR